MSIDIDRFFLELALEEAEQALKEDTYPVGAVIVDENFNLISRGRNRVHPAKDATAHAEINAIRNAGQATFNAKIKRENFTIYSSSLSNEYRGNFICKYQKSCLAAK